MYRIIVFAKAPVPGEAKTRLAPLLGLEGAAQVAAEMLEKTCIEARSVAGARMELCTSPARTDARWSGLLPEKVAITAQGEGDLGARLARAAQRVVQEGDWPVLIGTDCPDLDRNKLSTACLALEHNEAMIHPTKDGGYALLALRRFSPLLFSGISWSGPEVAARTIARLRTLGWSYVEGEVLRDIDEPSDYEWYVRERQGSR